jgi:hypothetical protein
VQDPIVDAEIGHVCGKLPNGPLSPFAQAKEKIDAINFTLESEALPALRNEADKATPPFCTDGMNLGGFTQFSNPTILAIQNPPSARTGSCNADSAEPNKACHDNTDCPGGTCITHVGQDFLGFTGDIVTGQVIDTGEGCPKKLVPPPGVCP